MSSVNSNHSDSQLHVCIIIIIMIIINSRFSSVKKFLKITCCWNVQYYQNHALVLFSGLRPTKMGVDVGLLSLMASAMVMVEPDA